MKKEVAVVVSPNASRTGAPTLLLRYLEWVKLNSDLQFLILLDDGGPMLPNFENIGKTYLWSEIISLNNKSFIIRVLLKTFSRLLPNFNWLVYSFEKKIKSNYTAKIIISNTSINGDCLKIVQTCFKCRTVTYVHEGSGLLRSMNCVDLAKSNFEKSTELIAVSDFVRSMLIKEYSLNLPIHIVGGSINSKNGILHSANHIKTENRIPKDKFIVMCCGYLSRHKGTDVFVSVVSQLEKSSDQFHFVWLGGDCNSASYLQMIFDLEKLKLLHKVSFIFSVNNSLDYLNIADVLLVLSREESFSLVTAEAGFLGKPILCFENSGGPAEIVDFDSRFLIPYLDVIGLSSRIQELADSPKEAAEMGKYLHNRVIENYTIDLQANNFFNILFNKG